MFHCYGCCCFVFLEGFATEIIKRDTLTVLSQDELEMRRQLFANAHTDGNDQQFISHAGDLDQEIIYKNAVK